MTKGQKMRDPERIDVVLDAVREAWVRNPDARLTQLIYTAAYLGAASDPRAVGVVPADFDIFYVEDNALLRGLSL